MPEKINKGKLLLIPVPLAGDTQGQVLPPQVFSAVGGLRHYMAENIRSARRFISSLKLQVPIEEIIFFELQKETPAASLQAYFEPLLAGHDMGVLSEAGCPGVADPGAMAVDYAHRHGVQVVPLTGPSSILLALMASGFNGQSFIFHGYLPIDKAERARAIKEMEKNSSIYGRTEIFMETPYRNLALFQSLLENCQPSTRLCIASALTSHTEFILTQTIAAWKQQEPAIDKQPAIFLISKQN